MTHGRHRRGSSRRVDAARQRRREPTARARASHGPPGHLDLGDAAALRQLLDLMAIGIAGCRVHLGIGARGIGPQFCLDEAGVLKESVQSSAPIRRILVIEFPTETWLTAWRWRSRRVTSSAELPASTIRSSIQASTGPIGRSSSRTRFSSSTTKPSESGGPSVASSARIDHCVGGPLTCTREQAVGPAIREGALGPSRGLLVRQPTDILDEPEPQHDRHGPQLADRERRHGLEPLDVLKEVFAVEAGVGMGDEVERESIDARRASPGPSASAAAERGSRGKILDDLAELLLDNVEVVEQPLLRGGEIAPLTATASIDA